jgi:hypothetical protein
MNAVNDQKAETQKLSFCLQLAHCIDRKCDGNPTEIAHVELNNWATFELHCPVCKKDFDVKIEI